MNYKLIQNQDHYLGTWDPEAKPTQSAVHTWSRHRYPAPKVIMMVGERSEFEYLTRLSPKHKEYQEGVEFICVNEERKIYGYRAEAAGYIMMETARRLQQIDYIRAIICGRRYVEEIEFSDTIVHELIVMYSHQCVLQRAIASKFSRDLATLDNFKTIGSTELSSFSTLDFSMMGVPFLQVEIPLLPGWEHRNVKLL